MGSLSPQAALRPDECLSYLRPQTGAAGAADVRAGAPAAGSGQKPLEAGQYRGDGDKRLASLTHQRARAPSSATPRSRV